MTDQIERIQSKIHRLKAADKKLAHFGASTHRYQLNPVLPVEAIRSFGQKHNITLPADYVLFLTAIGNGGAGPFYGLEPLENVLFDDLDNHRPDSLLNPSMPFLHTTAWNMDFEPGVDEEENEAAYEQQRLAFEEIYFARERMNGTLAICNFGCAISLNLVVNGQEYGYIWTDDRAGDEGIHPSHELGNKEKLGFADWYELWLDNALKEMSDKTLLPDELNKTGKRKWWQFW